MIYSLRFVAKNWVMIDLLNPIRVLLTILVSCEIC